MSKTRYEETHPVISFRVDQQTYDELQECRETGTSYGDIFRVGLGKQEACNNVLVNRIEELELELSTLREKVEKGELTLGQEGEEVSEQQQEIKKLTDKLYSLEANINQYRYFPDNLTADWGRFDEINRTYKTPEEYLESLLKQRDKLRALVKDKQAVPTP